MKNSFKKAWGIFKYLFPILTLLFWVLIVIDDWSLFVKQPIGDLFLLFGIWVIYYVFYALYFAIWYWGISSILIVVYHKLIKPRMNKKLPKEDEY